LLEEVGVPSGSLDDERDRVVIPLSILKLSGDRQRSAATAASSCWILIYRNRSA